MTTRAKHSEIARRYAWHARQCKANLRSVRWAELVRLLRHRLGGDISRADLEQHIIAAAGADWDVRGAVTLGGRISLTLAERMRLDIRTIWPCDVMRAQVKAAYAERRREHDREYRRRIRAQKTENVKMNHDLSVRQETLFAQLRGSGRWMTVRELANTVRDWPAWKRPDGRVQKMASLRVLVRRELDALGGQGIIEQSREYGATTSGRSQRTPKVGLSEQTLASRPRSLIHRPACGAQALVRHPALKGA